MKISLFYVYSGQKAEKPTSISLLIRTAENTQQPLFGANPSLIIIADNKRFRLGSMLQTVDFSASFTKETLLISIPYEIFAEIANAAIGEIQIGNYDFRLSELNLKSFRMIAGLPLKPEAPRVEAPLSPTNDGNILRVENTFWHGEQLSVEFRPNGVATFRPNNAKGIGFLHSDRERSGSWRQRGDCIEVEISSDSFGGLIVGVFKGDKMVLKVDYGALYRSFTTAVQLEP